MDKASNYTASLILICSITYSQWTQVAQLNNLGETPSISMPDCNTIVVAGGTSGGPAIYRSTNGGINFSNITTTEITYALYCVWALNKDTIFAGDGGGASGQGGNARIYRTTNGGISWSIILTTGGNSGFINGIVFERPTQNFGIIVSDPPIATDSFWIAVTSNKGGNWNIKRAPQPAPFCAQNSVFVVDNLFFGFGLNATPAKFYMTTNGGINWVVRILGLSGNSVTTIAYNSNKINGIAVSNASLPNIALTSNGGVNWQPHQITNGLNGFGIVKWVPGTNIYYICADSIKRTSNSGFSWEKMNTNGVYHYDHMDLISAGSNNICACAISDNGRVVKYEGEPFGIKQVSTEIPENFDLKQNYPNPFNPSTNIRFEISEVRFVKLIIHDSKGKEITTLINKPLHPGIYEIQWDSKNISSGIYYYSLLSGDYSETRKMVLLK